VKKIPNKNNFR